LLINLRYLTKDVAFKEEQECRIVKILPLSSDDVKLNEDYKQMYIEYIDIFHDNHYISNVIFGPKATGSNLFGNILIKKGHHIYCEQSKSPLA
jgi:hypothetical protein